MCKTDSELQCAVLYNKGMHTHVHLPVQTYDMSKLPVPVILEVLWPTISQGLRHLDYIVYILLDVLLIKLHGNNGYFAKKHGFCVYNPIHILYTQLRVFGKKNFHALTLCSSKIFFFTCFSN